MTQLQSTFQPTKTYKVGTAYSQSEASVYDDKRFTLPSGKRIHQFELDQLLWGVGHVEHDAKMLEVGCGTGRLLIELLRREKNVKGLDASNPMLEQLRAKLGDARLHAELFYGEAAKTEMADNEFDLVYSIRVLNQTDSPQYALDAVHEMIRLTKPGGYILAEFVNDYRPRWGKSAHPKREKTTRLRPHQVAEAGKLAGADLVGFRGCFFLGMQAYLFSPQPLLPMVSIADRFLSAMFPRLCARTYALFCKRS